MGKSRILILFFEWQSSFFFLGEGLAATHDSWEPQIKGLTGAIEPNEEEVAASIDGDGNLDDDDEEAQSGIEVCCFDNRGVGKSSVPMKKSQYTYASCSCGNVPTCMFGGHRYYNARLELYVICWKFSEIRTLYHAYFFPLL